MKGGKVVNFEMTLEWDGYRLLSETQSAKYYVSEDGKLAKRTKNTFKELGYIEDNMQLYKRLVESI